MATWLRKQGNGTRREIQVINARLIQLESSINPHDLVGADRPPTGGT